MAERLDAGTLRQAIEIFAESLWVHRDELNSLNVYPVPDGDTGTNMLLTQEAVLAAIDSSDDGTTDLATLGREIGHASLMGARGNSGVILSQVLRGVCDALGDSEVHAEELATALIGASDAAYRAGARPAAGTMLSVLRDAAREATAVADAGADLPAVAEASLRAARTSLASTREILPALKEAGMIDAGGKGIVLLLDAIRAALRDGLLSRLESDLGPIGGDDVQSPEPSPFHS